MSGLNTDTNLLLHCDGTDGSTTIPDSSTADAKGNATIGGTAQLDTAIKKWGTASLLLDGNSDYITYADSDDWDLCSSVVDSVTLDMQVKFGDHTGTEFLISHYQDANNKWQLYHSGPGGFAFTVTSAGVQTHTLVWGTEVTDTDWHHIALIRVADEWGFYLDGVQSAYLQDSDTSTQSGLLTIGRAEEGTSGYFYGSLDEIRIQRSNYFSAAPNVGETNTITVPTEAYSVDATSNVQVIIL